jgi:hypothetical protein
MKRSKKKDCCKIKLYQKQFQIYLLTAKNIKITNLVQEESDKIFILVFHSMTEGCIVTVRIINICS